MLHKKTIAFLLFMTLVLSSQGYCEVKKVSEPLNDASKSLKNAQDLFKNAPEQLKKSAPLISNPLKKVSAEFRKDSVDVVLLLDSSGSMKHTDPFNLRLPAAKLFVSLLGAKDRVSIVSFATNTRVLIPLTLVKGQDENRDQLIKAINKVTSTGLWTNIYDALDKGYEILDKNARKDSQPIVILMSDGKMDTSDTALDAKLTEALKTTLLRKYKERGITIYTLAFSEESDKNLLEYIAKATNGLFYVDLTSDNLHMRFTSIFENLKAPDMLPMEENSFLVDKTIEEVTIIANKATQQTTITLVSPAKKEYTVKAKPDFIKWSPSNQFDMITLTKPEAGRWIIKFSTEKGNKAYIVTNLKLQTDFNSQYIKMNDQITVNSWLVKDKDIIVEPAILSRITMTTELSLPDGKSNLIPLYDNGEGVDKVKGDGRYAGVIKPVSPGQYILKVRASGGTFERSQNFTFIVNKPEEVMPLTEKNPPEKETENKAENKDNEKENPQPLKQDIEKELKPQAEKKTSAGDKNILDTKITLGNRIKGLTLRPALFTLLKINVVLLLIVALYFLTKKTSLLTNAIVEKLKKPLTGLKSLKIKRKRKKK